MANEIVNIGPPPILAKDIEALNVGQSLKADTTSLNSLRSTASRIGKATDRAFRTWSKDGEFFVSRIS